jgi:hypothetical protein
MNRILFSLAVCLMLLPAHGRCQDNPAAPSRYAKEASEFIFSFGTVNEDSSSVDGRPVSASNPARFSGFFNIQEQFHFDFTKNIGIYTGLGIRNIGFIHVFNDSLKVKVKQRQYTLGLPLALKLGNLKKNFFFVVGAEMELFFNYKQKVFYNNRKDKFSEWFSSNSDLLNPSFFAEINLPKGSYVRVRYYPNDFLKQNPNGVSLSGATSTLNYDFSPSTLMYFSFGTALDWDKDRSRKGDGNQRASLR